MKLFDRLKTMTLEEYVNWHMSEGIEIEAQVQKAVLHAAVYNKISEEEQKSYYARLIRDIMSAEETKVKEVIPEVSFNKKKEVE